MKTKAIVIVGLLLAATFAGLMTAVSAAPAEEKIPDLRVSDVWRGYIGPIRRWQIGYRMYNAGEGNVVNADFWDAGYYKWGDWYEITASRIHHTNFNLPSQTYSDSYHYIYGRHIVNIQIYYLLVK